MAQLTNAPFRDRADAARLLAEKLKGRTLRNPLVLAIPRGGVPTGATLAHEIHAELDVILSRKLRSPVELETAIGAVGEDGQIFLDPEAWSIPEMSERYLELEKQHQLADIAQSRSLVRAVRPPAAMSGRTVIVTDDGMATGASMMAALRTVRSHHPHELIVAVPIATPERLKEIQPLCDDVICLVTPDDFWALGQFYVRFEHIDDDQVVSILKEMNPMCGVGTCPAHTETGPHRE